MRTVKLNSNKISARPAKSKSDGIRLRCPDTAHLRCIPVVVSRATFLRIRGAGESHVERCGRRCGRCVDCPEWSDPGSPDGGLCILPFLVLADNGGKLVRTAGVHRHGLQRVRICARTDGQRHERETLDGGRTSGGASTVHRVSIFGDARVLCAAPQPVGHIAPDGDDAPAKLSSRKKVTVIREDSEWEQSRFLAVPRRSFPL